jgi:N6-L-threonylcarbamoyladenine synthase
MRILAIETSCDDTGVSVLEAKNGKLFLKSNFVSSQVELHRKWGGIHPTLAKREHQKNLVPVLMNALKEAKLLRKKKIKKNEFGKIDQILEKETELLKRLKPFLKNYESPGIDLVAVTEGPGLEPALWVGVNFAKALSYSWQKPIVPVNHVEAHILANWLPQNGKQGKIKLPAICLVVSGGHTQLILMKGQNRYRLIGETRDDAAGECFDKIARILGLEYPGGPAIAREAEKAKKGNVKLPRPMISQKNYDFSFSGLKTAVFYNSQERKKSKGYVRQVAKESQQAIIDVLIKKTLKAAKGFKVRSILLGGGVASNKELRRQISESIKKEIPNIALYVPDLKYCTDNAAIVAVAASFHSKRTKPWQKIKADPNLRLK